MHVHDRCGGLGCQGGWPQKAQISQSGGLRGAWFGRACFSGGRRAGHPFRTDGRFLAVVRYDAELRRWKLGKVFEVGYTEGDSRMEGMVDAVICSFIEMARSSIRVVANLHAVGVSIGWR